MTCSMTRCRKLAVKGQEQCKLHQFVIRKPLGMDGLVAEMKSSVPKDSQVEQNEPRLVRALESNVFYIIIVYGTDCVCGCIACRK